MTIAAHGLGFEVRDRRLLGGLDVRIEAGEIVSLVGPNGAGKTTALGLLAGDLTPSAGRVTIADRPLAELPLAELALLRAVLPARSLTDVPFTVREIVELGRRPHGDAHTHGSSIVDECLRATDTSDLASRTYSELSTGEQARVTLARVLAQSTPVLLLDEPTASLDVRHAALVMETLRRTAEGGVAVIAVLHDLNLAARHSDRIAVLENGSVAALGPPRDVLSTDLLSRVYEHPVTVVEHPLDGSVLVLS